VLVGENSGCSGCVLGTQGLCDWVEITRVPHMPSNLPTTLGLHNSVNINYPGTRSVGSVRFQCLPSRYADEVFVEFPSVFSSAASMCPADPKKEPIIRQNLDIGSESAESQTSNPNSYVNISVAHTFLSRTHKSKTIAFPSDPWPVDRSSRWANAGMLLFTPSDVFNAAQDTFEHHGSDGGSWELSNYASWDCAALNNPENLQSDPNWREGLSGDSPGKFLTKVPNTTNVIDDLLYMCPHGGIPQAGVPFNGTTDLFNWDYTESGTPLWREQEKFCARQILNGYASTRCPRYGQAISGICQSTFLLFAANCVQSHIDTWSDNSGVWTQSSVGYQTYPTPANTWPTPVLQYGNLLGYRVVDDATPWCLDSFDVQINGQFESIIGLHKSLAELNSFELAECYACCND